MSDKKITIIVKRPKRKKRGRPAKQGRKKTPKTKTKAYKKDAKKNKEAKVKIAYVIKDKIFGDFSAVKSANAWWIEKKKVENLISAFKIGCDPSEARIYAGITKKQWFYFLDKHPEFCDIMEACQEYPNLKARTKINKELDDNLANAQWWLTKKKPKEFGDKQTVIVEDEPDFDEEAEKRARKYES